MQSRTSVNPTQPALGGEQLGGRIVQPLTVRAPALSALLLGDPLQAMVCHALSIRRIVKTRDTGDSMSSSAPSRSAIRGVSAGAFVVQQHQATARHFDLRLEVDGVMRSWAVPKGPSLDPAVKRLAVQVEDHSLDYNSFEGRSEDGAVIVWDRGHYEQGGRVPWPEALDRGHAVFVLHGEKLSGGFALQRTRPGPKAQWLLIKRRDEQARPGSDVVAEHPRSALSGRTLDELLSQSG